MDAVEKCGADQVVVGDAEHGLQGGVGPAHTPVDVAQRHPDGRRRHHGVKDLDGRVAGLLGLDACGHLAKRRLQLMRSATPVPDELPDDLGPQHRTVGAPHADGDRDGVGPVEQRGQGRVGQVDVVVVDELEDVRAEQFRGRTAEDATGRRRRPQPGAVQPVDADDLVGPLGDHAEGAFGLRETQLGGAGSVDDGETRQRGTGWSRLVVREHVGVDAKPRVFAGRVAAALHAEQHPGLGSTGAQGGVRRQFVARHRIAVDGDRRPALIDDRASQQLLDGQPEDGCGGRGAGDEPPVGAADDDAELGDRNSTQHARGHRLEFGVRPRGLPGGGRRTG